ncbi:major capsid protein [Arthrobacter sp. FW306-2-2C-D06B]|uniref:major capsid protein n=1 Tax=Arthrobacter sp. FW306-2-2C-D06B TaxID=2879618 RepID=UPI001F40A4E5|nr:major capsid protein [Arthrobacter sp. FW306-2-2C-D06B]UKA59165.1 major capsid protein [Arthrobacter sp. FW306-2-2C-D06B]
MALVLSSEYITPTELTGYVRAALADLPQNAFGLSAFLPDVPTDDIDFRASVGGGGLARVAKYRAWDTESPISGRRGIDRISGELPPISEKRRLSEYDRLKMRKLSSGIIDAILNDAVDLARAIHARVEVARGQALTEGKVTLSENGLTLEADFGRKASHTQTAAVKWNVDGSNPVDDFLAWQKVYVATNGVRPGATMASQDIQAALMRNKAIRDMTLPAGSTQQIVTIDAINALFRSFGLPALSTYDAQVEGDDGSAKSIIDPKKVIFLPPADRKLGETLWGVTAESLDAEYGIDATDAPGVVVGSYSDKDPVGLWTKASAIALPVPANSNLTLAATVL